MTTWHLVITLLADPAAARLLLERMRPWPKTRVFRHKLSGIEAKTPPAEGAAT